MAFLRDNGSRPAAGAASSTRTRSGPRPRCGCRKSWSSGPHGESALHQQLDSLGEWRPAAPPELLHPPRPDRPALAVWIKKQILLPPLRWLVEPVEVQRLAAGPPERQAPPPPRGDGPGDRPPQVPPGPLEKGRRRQAGPAMKIAFVLHRYGADIVGGSEYHCRRIAEQLAARHTVEVLTTTASDYVTWKDGYAEGVETINGVTVRRFRVKHPPQPGPVQGDLRPLLSRQGPHAPRTRRPGSAPTARTAPTSSASSASTRPTTTSSSFYSFRYTTPTSACPKWPTKPSSSPRPRRMRPST